MCQEAAPALRGAKHIGVNSGKAFNHGADDSKVLNISMCLSALLDWGQCS